VSVALSVPGFIMTETTLSYLGLGIADPAVSWGSLIKRDISTLANLKAYTWLLNPVWFLLGVTLAFNFLGDALRDYFDPYHTIFYRFTWPWKKNKNEKGRMKNEEAASAAPGDSAGALLSVRDLAVSFSVLRGRERTVVQAVRGISFDLERGEILGIVGESGSGKSVSTQAIPSLLPGNASVSGSILYEGKEILGLPASSLLRFAHKTFKNRQSGDFLPCKLHKEPDNRGFDGFFSEKSHQNLQVKQAPKGLREYRGKKIGMIFQEPGRSYDPLQNMEGVFLETFRNSFPEITKEEARERAAALLKETGLDGAPERLRNFPHQFSGGQLQRIGIALALAQGCELLIADEPTTALDVTIQKQIAGLLKSLQQSRKISIIFISHDIDLVADISGRILVMYGGLVMESGTSAELIAAPLHPYTRALLAASPRFGSHYSRSRLEVIPGRVPDPSRPEPGCPFAPRCSRALPECSGKIPALSATGERHDVRCLNYRG
jgi:peptide/nickel transport system permease protein